MQNLKLILKTYRLELSILFFISVGAYSNTITHDYALDDQLAIYDNQFVTQGFDGIYDILTRDAFEGFFGERGSKLIQGGRYRPLSFISFAVEWEIFGRNPMVNHILNIIFYGLLCSSIFLLLIIIFPYKIVEKKSIDSFINLPFIASVLYALHPIHTEVVANIKGRDEIYCFLFGVTSIIYFFQFYSQSIQSKLILFILFLLALLSKENAITFLALFPIIAFMKNEKWINFEFVKKCLPFILATSFYLLLRSKFLQSGLDAQSSEILNNPFARADFSQKWATILYSFFKYISLLIFPHPLSHDYYFNQIPYKKFSDLTVMSSILGIIFILIFYIKNYKSKSALVFSILFFILSFSIVSNILFTVGIIMNERFVFISSLGFCVALAYMIQKIQQPKFKIIQLAILAILVLGYSFKTFTRNLAWKDNPTLFATDYYISNQSAKVSTSHGGMLLETSSTITDKILKSKCLDSSIEVLAHAIDIYPENSQSWLLYGNAIYAKTNNVKQAADIYHKALSFRPSGFFDAYYNLGILFYNQNLYDSSQIYLEKGLAMQPQHKEVREILSRIYAKQGRTDEAIKIAGTNIANLSELAMNAKDGGNYPEAIQLANQALAANPNDPKANFVIGICYARFMGKINEGIPYLEKAVAIDKNGFWMEDLAVAYGMTGRIKETIPLLEEVIRQRPNEPAGYQNLATTYAKLGDNKKASYYMNLARTK